MVLHPALADAGEARELTIQLPQLCFTRPKEAGTPRNPSTGKAEVGLWSASDQFGVLGELTQARAT